MSLFIEDPTPTSGPPAGAGEHLIGPPGEGLHEAVVRAAARHALDPTALDWHLEAVHGMERHDAGYVASAEIAAKCLAAGGCERSGTATFDATATTSRPALLGIAPGGMGVDELAEGDVETCGCGTCACGNLTAADVAADFPHLETP